LACQSWVSNDATKVLLVREVKHSGKKLTKVAVIERPGLGRNCLLSWFPPMVF